MKYKKLFSPVKVGSVTLKNRFAMAPMGPLGLADANGGWNQRGIDYYVERAKGGTGLIITGVTFFDQVVEKQDRSGNPAWEKRVSASGTFYAQSRTDAAKRTNRGKALGI